MFYVEEIRACELSSCEGSYFSIEGSDQRAQATTVTEAGDHIDVNTTGSKPAILFVAQPLLRRTLVMVNGRNIKAFPANLAFLGIPVPASESKVMVRW
jgi:hypothetical protein